MGLFSSKPGTDPDEETCKIGRAALEGASA